MPGIQDLYVDHAERHISRHEKSNTASRISRKRVELEILQALDEAPLPIEYKMSWYHAILSTPLFDSLWLATSRRNGLPPSCTVRYTPSGSLQGYETPSNSSGSAASSPPPHLPFQTPDHTRAHEGSFTTPGSGYRPDDDSEGDPDAVDFAARVGGGTAASATKRERESSEKHGFGLLDPNGLARQEGDDGAYGSPIRKQRRGSGIKTRGGGGMSKPPRARTPKKEVKFANGEVAVELARGEKQRRNAVVGAMGMGMRGRQRKLTPKAKALVEEGAGPGI